VWPVTSQIGPRTASYTHYNSLGQVDWVADALSNRTTFVYDTTTGRRIAVTDALSNTIHTAYDPEGRIIATWGATYPVAYEYDPFGRMVAMATTRESTNDFAALAAQLAAGASIMSIGSTGSLDITQWLYDQPTGLLTNKLYADNLGPSYTYTPDGRLATRTWARGVTTTYAYDPASGAMTNIAYSDSTPSVSFSYDRLGRQKVAQTFLSATSPATLYTRDYTLAGQVQRESTIFGNALFTLTEKFDTLGRTEGYALSNTVSGISTMISDTTHAYDPVGRLERVAVGGMGEFRYGYLPDADLVQTLAMPNGVTRTVVYDPHRNLPISVTHTNPAGTILAQRTYSYDSINRLTERTQVRAGDVPRPDAFDYNERSELSTALLGTNGYAYAFDSIGNRQTAIENTITNAYLANPLNQYTNILRVSATPREDLPVFDLDGNQTLLHTTTGSWQVDYNAENRPVLFSNETAVITMAYDHQCRRTEMKVMQSGATTRHERYLYRGYLQLAALNLLDATNVIHAITWDPTEPVATRPLGIHLEGEGEGMYTYGFDQVKNVTELFDATGALAATYDYAPFGALTSATGPASDINPLTFSSEIHDTPLGLIYYNFRHLNVLDGWWVNRDPIGEKGGYNYYAYVQNSPYVYFDELGLIVADRTGYDYAIYFGVGSPDGNAIIARAAAYAAREVAAQFKQNDDSTCTNKCIFSVGNLIQSKELRLASKTYDSLYFNGHGEPERLLNPDWRPGMPLTGRNLPPRTKLNFSDGWKFLSDVLTESTVTAKTITPYVCYDRFVDSTNPSGIAVIKFFDSPDPVPSWRTADLVTVMVNEFRAKKCKTVEVRGP